MQKFRIAILIILSALFIASCGQGPKWEEVTDVETPFQRAGDENGDGMLEGWELERMAQALKEELRSPHKIGHPVIEIFDYNHDGFLDEGEMEDARNRLVYEVLPRLMEVDWEAAKTIDENGNDQIDRHESEFIKVFLFHPDARENKPRAANDFWSESQDLNKDGRVQPREIEEVSIWLLKQIIKVPFGGGDKKPQEDNKSGFPVENRLQKVMDLNNDNYVDRGEIDKSFEIYKEMDKRPRESGGTGVQALYDLNNDGFISKEEFKEIDEFMNRIKERVRQSVKQNNGFNVAGPLDKVFDLDNNGFVGIDEIRQVANFFEELEKRPHEALSKASRQLDLDKNGFISLQEIKEIANRIDLLRKEFLRTEETITEGKPVENILEEMADVNGNRIVEPNEFAAMEKGLMEPHEVRNLFDRRIDYNQNNFVEPFEIEKAARAREIILEKKAGDASYQVRTPIDGIFDLNNNGQIEEKEIEKMVDFFLRGSHKADKGFKLDKLFDMNNDGIIHEEEMFFVLENFLRPHPANYKEKIDKESDKNGNRFIEPEEIGVAAGLTSLGDRPSFEEIIKEKQVRMEMEMEKEKPEYVEEPKKTPSPTTTEEKIVEAPTPTPKPEKKTDEETLFQKKIDIKEKKLAVVELKSSSTDNGNGDTSTAIIMFVENAFVNIGDAKVVDRQNITKIVEEYQFQGSDLTDSSTAVQIGKLAGAEIIVIGNLNYVGEKYYLNIKLLSVETAEILGSSIETAKDDTEFYDMCNNAVYKLF